MTLSAAIHRVASLKPVVVAGVLGTVLVVGAGVAIASTGVDQSGRSGREDRV